MTLKLQFPFLGCMGKAMPKVMLKLTPFCSQPSHQVSLIFTCGCSETQVCRCRAGIFSVSIRCGCLPHPSGGGSLALALLPGQEDAVVPGKGTATWGELCRVPPARLGVASEGSEHSLEWASKCLGKGGFYKDRSFEIHLQRRQGLSCLLCVTGRTVTAPTI